jgi:arylsulfatase A-like enzyme/Flp pilus assembly protein TadD
LTVRRRSNISRMMHFSQRRIGLALGVLLLMTACGGGAKVPRLSGKAGDNLLLIILDTTRADRIGSYGYAKAETPNIDALARSGILFSNAYTSVPLTLPSHATIFTGREPFVHGVRNNGNYALPADENTLAEVMRTRGFGTYAVVASFVLHSKFGLDQGFENYDDSLDYNAPAGTLRTEIDASRVYARFKNWLDRSPASPFFAWVHFFDPHSPYDPPTEFKSRFEDPYDGEIAYADVYVGKIVADLRAKGLLEKTLIVIAGDHGEAFGEHKELGHGIFCYEEGIRVPLVFSHPSLSGSGPRRVGQTVRLVDVMPTLLDLFGEGSPPNLQGQSFAPLLAAGKAKEMPVYFESLLGQEDMGWAPLTGLIHRGHKFIALPEPELYDLEADAAEKRNLFGENNVLAREIDGRLRSYLQAPASPGAAARRDVSASDRERLESLGYVSSFAGKNQTALDPKAGIDGLNEVLSIKKLFDEGQTEEAEKRFNELRRSSPAMLLPQFYDNLANFYKDKGDLAKAAQVTEEAIEQFPNQERFRMNLAMFYFGAGEVTKAETLCLDLVRMNAGLAQAHSLLGTIHKARGELDKAAESFARAAEAEPRNIRLQLDRAEAELALGNRGRTLEIVGAFLENETLMDDPQGAEVWILMGVLLAQAGDIGRAAGLFDRIIERGEATVKVWTHRGLCYFEKGDWARAEDSYRRALEIDGDDALALSSLGTLSLARFRAERDPALHARAVAYYEHALRTDPFLASAYNGLAVAYRYNRQTDRAVELWKKALEVKPDFTDASLNLGMTLLDLGKAGEALRILESCRDKYISKLSPSDRERLLELIDRANKAFSREGR